MCEPQLRALRARLSATALHQEQTTWGVSVAWTFCLDVCREQIRLLMSRNSRDGRAEGLRKSWLTTLVFCFCFVLIFFPIKTAPRVVRRRCGRCCGSGETRLVVLLVYLILLFLQLHIRTLVALVPRVTVPQIGKPRPWPFHYF